MMICHWEEFEPFSSLQILFFPSGPTSMCHVRTQSFRHFSKRHLLFWVTDAWTNPIRFNTIILIWALEKPPTRTWSGFNQKNSEKHILYLWADGKNISNYDIDWPSYLIASTFQGLLNNLFKALQQSPSPTPASPMISLEIPRSLN